MIYETWALICEFSLWGWIAAATGFILQSFPSRGVFRTGPAIVWGGSFIAFYILWIVGMLSA